MLTVLVSVLLFGTAATFVSYNFYRENAEGELRTVADTIVQSDYTTEEMTQILRDDNLSYPIRLTVIDTDGTVLFDNETDATQMENHSTRQEFKEAMQSGKGEALRYSHTLGETTYYYALQYHGSIVRFSRDMNSIVSVFVKMIPVTVAIGIATILIAALASAWLSRRLIQPVTDLIGQIPVTDNPYDRTYLRVPGKYEELKPIADSMNGFLRLAAERMAQLRHERDMFAVITRNMTEGIVILGSELEILSVNESAVRMLNPAFHGSKGVRKTLPELSRLPKLLEAAETAKAEGRADVVLSCGERFVRAFLNKTAAQGEVGFGLVILLVDVTESMENEQIRREFSANVSHELKTPLTTIKGFGEMLKDGMLTAPEDLEKYGGTIFRESDRMLTLINDIIRLTEIEENKSAEKSEVHLLAVANETAESLTRKAKEHGVTLTVSGEDVQIQGLASYVSEILFNLADNAVKYNNPGGSVEITITDGGENGVISVKDTGIGIPKEAQNRIFERFYRVDKSRSRKTAGTGLGLSIVKHAVAFHGGTIALESEPGRGTEIVITLPKEPESR